MINTRIINKSGLKTLNAWKVSIGKEKFIVTPAHNIIYKPDKNKSFQSSPFVPKKFNTGWFVCKQYVESSEYNLLYDLAWKPIGKNSQSIQSELVESKLTQVHKINYFYYQPYDYNGIKVSKQNYSLGCGQAIIYKSPNNHNSLNNNNEYFEAINMGFRGMSGAIVTNLESDKFLGLFIRKIGNLGTNLSDSTIQTELVGVSRGFIMPVRQIEKLIYSPNTIKIL
jgi:hypothetical protein